MNIIKLDSYTDRDLILKYIGSTNAGNLILRDKIGVNLLYLKDIKTPAANILKQDALSIGADLAVPKNTILYKDELVCGLLIANDKQLKILSQKESFQPFGLKKFALELKNHIKTKHFDRQIMGVLNINEDSFYKGSRYVGEDANIKIDSLISEGADIIDIGALSSRPGSEKISAKDELNRVRPIIDEIYLKKLYEKVDFSLDSYEPLVLEYALDRGFKIVNDITGLVNDEVAKLASRYSAKVIIMHMLGTPHNMQNSPKYEDVILDIEEFFKLRVQKAKSFGIDEIVLDVGIGFGKTLEDNLKLIKHLSHFKKFSLPILIGASRKSIIDKISPSTPSNRLAGTLALHLKAHQEGASIIRCHDVFEHIQAFKVVDVLKETLL